MTRLLLALALSALLVYFLPRLLHAATSLVLVCVVAALSVGVAGDSWSKRRKAARR